MVVEAVQDLVHTLTEGSKNWVCKSWTSSKGRVRKCASWAPSSVTPFSPSNNKNIRGNLADLARVPKNKRIKGQRKVQNSGGASSKRPWAAWSFGHTTTILNLGKFGGLVAPLHPFQRPWNQSSNYFFRSLGLETCKFWLDIPLDYRSTEKYNGTFGHKANHNFDSNVKYSLIETARYILCFL